MSDAIIVSLITAAGLIISGVINTRQNKKITEKVDSYHKDVNGKMGELLVTTKALGNAEGKAEEKAEQKETDK